MAGAGLLGDPVDLRVAVDEHPITLYLCFEPDEQDRLGPHLRVVVSQLAGAILERDASWRWARRRAVRLAQHAPRPGRRADSLPLDSHRRLLMDRGFESLGFSAREATSLLKVARTVEDLAGRNSIRAADLAEAMQYKAEGRDALRPSSFGRPVPSRAFGAVPREAGEP